MELYQLRAFVATAETGQITRAAQRLHITQPAVSAQIKALEQELGVALFERLGSGVVLTRAGGELLKHARDVLAASNTIVAEGRKLRDGGSRELRLGTILHPQFIQLGRLVRELLEAFPLLQLKLRHGPSGNVMDGLFDGELDAAFFVGNTTSRGIASIPLAELEYCVVAGTSWARQLQDATLEQLCELPWLAAPATSSQSALLQQFFKNRAVMPPHVVEVDQETTRICLALEGIGLSLMRRELAMRYRREGKLVVWNGRGPCATLWFVELEASRDDPVLSAARGIVNRLWKDPGNTVDFDSLGALTDMPFKYEVQEQRGRQSGD